MSSPSGKPPQTTPRIILHGGCGNITRSNLPPALWRAHRAALLSILHSHSARLSSDPNATSLEIATSVVTALENNPLFNSGRGAVFTRAGTIELEASVMVSKGKRKRGVGVMGVTRVKNPILLAKEMLVRGEEDDGGGAHGHCQITGWECERLGGGNGGWIWWMGGIFGRGRGGRSIGLGWGRGRESMRRRGWRWVMERSLLAPLMRMRMVLMTLRGTVPTICHREL